MRWNEARRVASSSCKRFGEHADVAAGHEMLAGAFEHHDAHAVVGGQLAGSRDQRIDHRQVERIQRGGAVQRQCRDRTVAVEQNRVVHGAGTAARNGAAASKHSSTGESPNRSSAALTVAKWMSTTSSMFSA